MKEEEEYSILQKKFREWFEKIVQDEIPPPDVTDRTIGDPIPDDLPLCAEIDQTNGDLVMADLLPLLTERDYSKHRTVTKSAKILELLIYGLGVAIVFGAVVGFIIVLLNLTINSDFIIIILAMAVGFNIGLIKGHASQKRKGY